MIRPKPDADKGDSVGGISHHPDSSTPHTPPPTLDTPGLAVAIQVGAATFAVKLRTDGGGAIEIPGNGHTIYAPLNVEVRKVIAFLAMRLGGGKGGANA